MDTVRLALACYRSPMLYQGRFAASAPLPGDMDRVLALATGCSRSLAEAARQTGAEREELRKAARFLVQQVCFAPGGSHYRVLGLDCGASLAEIKEHHRRLMSLYHPDRAASTEGWTDSYAARANEAWSVLSRPAARSDYDAELARTDRRDHVSVPTGARRVPLGRRVRYVSGLSGPTPNHRLGPRRRVSAVWLVLALGLVLGAGGAAVRLLAPDPMPEAFVWTPAASAKSADRTPEPAGAGSAAGTDPASALTAKEIQTLVEGYVDAYQDGDLAALMALFAPNLAGSPVSDRAALRRDYARSFSVYAVRGLQLRDLSWELEADGAHVVIRYDLWLEGRQTGQRSQTTGTLRLRLNKYDGRVLVDAIDRQWPAL